MRRLARSSFLRPGKGALKMIELLALVCRSAKSASFWSFQPIFLKMLAMGHSGSGNSCATPAVLLSVLDMEDRGGLKVGDDYYGASASC